MSKHSYEILSEIVKYDPETGQLIRLKATTQRTKVGDVLKVNCNGYVSFTHEGVYYPGHRIAWFLYHQTWPVGVIDHINGDPSDNRLINLRDCPHKKNLLNRGAAKTSSSGVKNVYPIRGGYEVKLYVDGKSKYIGFYHDIELAELVATEARVKYHGEFASA